MCATELVGAGSKENPTGWTEEHCPPRWLQRHLRTSGVKGTSTHRGSRDEFAAVTEIAEVPTRVRKSPDRHPSPARMVYPDVCRRCNQGWMSDLEREVRPTLTALADGALSVQALDANQRGALARWAMKTAFFYSEIAIRKGQTPFIPPDHAQSVMKGLGVPPTVSVFGMSHGQTATFAACIGRTAVIQHPPGTTEEEMREHGLRNPFYKCTFLFGQLLLTVMHWPTPEGRIVVWPGVHHQIWPLEPRVLEAEWLMPFPLRPHSLLAFHLSLNVSAQGQPWENELEPREIEGRGYVLCHYHEHALFEFGAQEADLGIPWGEQISFKLGEKCPCGSGRAFDRCHGVPDG